MKLGFIRWLKLCFRVLESFKQVAPALYPIFQSQRTESLYDRKLRRRFGWSDKGNRFQDFRSPPREEDWRCGAVE